MSTTQQLRYYWKNGMGDGDTYSLIDRVSSRPIGRIVYIKSARRWQWFRHTSVLLHGVAPAEGVAKLLSEAKLCIEQSLPQEL